ncbi:hypothetical protein IWX90DRAFT_437243 [Phyllosticta citrichinensis]|uniref:Secreted protein n=1 Tax=Phyllosticta citrichinensis TaxID=1130410 RepID=A0ABR1XSG2_9PEZI
MPSSSSSSPPSSTNVLAFALLLWGCMQPCNLRPPTSPLSRPFHQSRCSSSLLMGPPRAETPIDRQHNSHRQPGSHHRLWSSMIPVFRRQVIVSGRLGRTITPAARQSGEPLSFVARKRKRCRLTHCSKVAVQAVVLSMYKNLCASMHACVDSRDRRPFPRC